MKRLLFALLTLFPFVAAGQGIVERGKDMSYRVLLESGIGAQIVRTANRLESAYDSAKEVEEIQKVDSTAVWCAKLWTGTPDCTAAGDAHFDWTKHAEQAHTQLVKLWECSQDMACNKNARLEKFRRASNELYGALRSESDPQITPKWRAAIERLARETRALNDEWTHKLRGVNGQTAQLMGSSTAQQLCNNQWFPDTGECGTDQPDRLRSEDLKAALDAMSTLYDCANDVACTVDHCTAASTPDACCTGAGAGTCTKDLMGDLQQFVRVR